MQIEQATALVTGSNRGLGREFVRLLLERGARKVYATARNPAALGEFARSHPGRVEVFALDITDAAQVEAAAARAGDIDLLVNNAGINRHQGFVAAPSMADAQAEIATNYLGTLAMCRAFAPRMAGGAIVNVLSILAKVALPAMGSLCASKAAGLRMTEGLRAEVAARGTRVLAVMTGALDTDMERDFQGPKSQPAEVVEAVFAALAKNDEEVYVGDMPGWINGELMRDPKGLERELAKYLPA